MVNQIMVRSLVSIISAPRILITHNATMLSTGANLIFTPANVFQKREIVLTIRNTGEEELILTGLAFTSDQFTSEPVAWPTAVLPGQSRTLKLYFQPSTSGILEGALTLSSNSDFNSEFLLNLSGTANKIEQVITFGTLPSKTVADAPFILSATSTSGLPIVYTSSDESIAIIEENKVSIKNPGEVLITASQAGNDVYNAATSVSQKLVITLVTGIESVISSSVYPNPVSETLTIDFDYTGIHHIQIHDIIGKEWASMMVNNITAKIDVSSLTPGLYLLKVHEENGMTRQHRIVKR